MSQPMLSSLPRKLFLGTLLVAALLFVTTLPGAAQVHPPGTDFWITQPGTLLDFSTSQNALPTNFFGCGETFQGTIAFSGDPVASQPDLRGTDTVLQRLDQLALTSGSATTRVRLVALSLLAPNWQGPCGNIWDVRVGLAQGAAQPIGSMTVKRTHSQGGTVSSAFSVVGDLTFTSSTGAVLGPVTYTMNVSSSGASWTDQASQNAVVVQSVTLDTDNDGVLDTTVSGNGSGFLPGWHADPGGPIRTSCPNNGTHPVEPPLADYVTVQ